MRVRQYRRDGPMRCYVGALRCRLNSARRERENASGHGYTVGFDWKRCDVTTRDNYSRPISRHSPKQRQQLRGGVGVAAWREIVDENETRAREQCVGDGEPRQPVRGELVNTTVCNCRESDALERVTDALCAVVER